MGQGPTGGAREREIHEVDEKERDAVLAADVTVLERLWAKDLVVNAPSNRVGQGRDAVLALVREGLIDYASFDRGVEALRLHGDVAILMGAETVTPRGKAPFAGQTVHRRFTNFWMKRDGRWQLTARQATIISRD